MKKELPGNFDIVWCKNICLVAHLMRNDPKPNLETYLYINVTLWIYYNLS